MCAMHIMRHSFVDKPRHALTGQQRQQTGIVMRTKPMREA